MSHRIVYCAEGCAPVLAQLPHEALRGLDGGAVASVPDDAMPALLTKTPTVPILYFSRQAYDDAMEGLSGPEVEEALHKRLSHWSGQALDYALEWIARDERRALTLTAIAWSRASGDNARVLQTHFDAALNLLTSIAGTGRYDDMEFVDLLSAVVEADALLIAELAHRPEAQTRSQFATALAEELKRRGRPEFAQALPYAEPQRGVFIEPADATLRNYLKARWESGVPWRDGAVADLPLRAMADFERAGKRIAVLYADPGALKQDANELTAAQLIKRFEQLAAAGEEGLTRQRDDYWNMLRLNVAGLRRVLRARAVKEDARVAAVAEPQIVAETQILAVELARSKSWLFPGDGGDPLERLKVAEDDSIGDATFFASVAQRRGNTYLAGRMHDLIARKRS